MSKILDLQSVTRNDFLGGRISAFQPKSGFRAGSDSVLLAAAVRKETTCILELGCGAGVAACCALSERAKAQALLVDMEAEALTLADKNLALNGFEKRAKTLLLDVTQKGSIREQAGLQTNCFSTIIANPPFFISSKGTGSPDALRKRARHMQKGELDNWVKTAAASASARGEIIFIHVMEALPELLAAFDARFGNIVILPIAPRAGEAATRVLIRGIKGSKAPLALMAPLILHGETGREFLPEVEAIFRGEGALHW